MIMTTAITTRNNRRGLLYPTNIFSEIEKMFGDMIGPQAWADLFNRRPSGMPPTELIRLNGHDELRFALAGFNKDELKVEVNGDTFCISAKRATEDDGERVWGNFARSGFRFTRRDLDRSYNLDSVSAQFENGVLTIRLPHKTDSAPKMREIEIS